MKQFNHTILFIVLCCFCIGIMGLTDNEIAFNAAMDSFKNSDFSNAFQIFQDLSEQGYGKAQFMLGKIYFNGEGVPQDYEKAVKWYTKAAEEGVLDAQLELVKIYQEGFGDQKKDFSQAEKWQMRAAEQGHADSQYVFGFISHTLKDETKAIDWYTKAARQGHLDAQLALAWLYYDSAGMPQDHKQSAYWYAKAAEQGSTEAQKHLALMYFKGQGVDQDIKKAYQLWSKAAIKGDTFSQSKIAWMFFEGKGVQQNFEQAIYWWTKAAEQGEANSQHRLGGMYYFGKGIPQDYERAVFWTSKAAEQGYADSQLCLGLMYYLGKGLPQNYFYSYVWFNLASVKGNEEAIRLRDDVAGLLSPQQLAQAQIFAAEIQNKIISPGFHDKMNPPEIFHYKPDNSKESETVNERSSKVKGSGTGFVITNDGYLLTCFHVIEGAEKIEIAIGEERKTAKVITTDSNTELAMLKMSGEFETLPFSSKRTLSMGEEVFTHGYPNPLMQGVNPKFTKGEISSLTGYKDDLRLYQISVPVQPGNSGGPLLDSYGNVCGLIVAMLDAETAFEVSGTLPQNVNYAVKSTYVHALLDTLPDIAAKLPPPMTKNMPVEDIVKKIEKSIVMVLAYK